MIALKRRADRLPGHERFEKRAKLVTPSTLIAELEEMNKRPRLRIETADAAKFIQSHGSPIVGEKQI